MRAHTIANRMRPRRHCHRGITLVEVTVAAAMLATLLATSVQMVRLASNGQRAAERQFVAMQVLQAIAELVGNTPWDELTPAAMDRIAVPAQTGPYLPGGKVAYAVADEADPIAKRISIELTWNGSTGPPPGKARLTTWVYPDR